MKKSERLFRAMMISLGLTLGNLGFAIHLHGESDIYLFNAMAAIFCGFLFVLNLFHYTDAKIDEDVEETSRRYLGK